MEIRKVLVLVPSAYNIKALGDVINFVDFYKNDLDIYILVKDLTEDVISFNDYSLVNIDTSYGRYLRSSADFVIDAGSIDGRYRKGKKQKWISVWHGIPYKKMFVDLDPSNVDLAINYSEAYDVMISSSPYYTSTFLRSSLMFDKEILEVGCSRMDSLFNYSTQKINDIKNELGIPNNKKVILYAPTFRSEGAFDLPFAPSKLTSNSDYVLIVKCHYLNYIGKGKEAVIDVTSYENISDLYLISDVLITDYSSVMFDYSILDKPIVLYQYDKEKYSNNRGFYFNVEDYFSNGNIVYNKEQLYELFDTGKFLGSKNRLKENFYPYEDGKSTKRIVEKINFDVSKRKNKDIIFLVNEVNEIGGVNTFINNMAEYYKKKYNCRIIIIGIKEFAVRNSKVHINNSEYIDFYLSDSYSKGAAKLFLKNTDGYIISTQFSAHLHFQKYLKNKNVSLMFHGNADLLVEAKQFWFHLEYLNKHKLYNYKKLLLLSKPNVEVLLPNLVDDVQEKLGYINNSIGLPFVELKKSEANNWAFIGRLSDEKNPLGLIDLGKKIKSENFDLKINIYGDGPLKNILEEKITENGLQNILYMRGYVVDKERIFSDNNGLILISKNEGYPYVILEAYAYGRPVVAYNTFASAPDMVIDGVTGYIVDNNDVDSLLKGIKLSSQLNIADIKNKYEMNTNEYIFSKWDKIFEENEKTSSIVKIKSKKKGNNKDKKKNTKQKNYFKRGIITLLDIVSKDFTENLRANKRRDKYLTKIEKYSSDIGVSFIVPYYNSAATIEKTLNSIKKQNLPNYEIIIVNDGSSDEQTTILRKICDKYRNINYNILLFEKENTGLGLTRNYGIERSTKDYIFFIDSDDTLPSDAIPSMLLKALETNANVVMGKTKRIYLSNKNEEIWYPGLTNNQRMDEDPSSRYHIYNDTLSTNKLYKKNVFSEFRLYFEQGLYEDKLFTAKLYSKVRNIYLLNKVVYNWLIYGSNKSITTSKNIQNYLERLDSISKCWYYYPEIVKINMIDFFLKHDLLIYLREFKYYSYEDKVIVFEKARQFLSDKTDYYYRPMNRSMLNRRLFRIIVEDNLDDFIRISDAISFGYNK